MTQSQVLDLLDMMREMVALQKKILERLDQPAPMAAVGNWQAWENLRSGDLVVLPPDSGA